MRRAFLGLLVLLSACEGQGEASANAMVEALSGVVDLRIGVLDGPAPYVFGRVAGIVEGPLGRIFVADQLVHEIRVFDTDGAFLFSIGREGQGPGEVTGPCCLSFAPDGTLWVRDGGNTRYVGFKITEHNAEPIATVRMAHSDGWLYAPLLFTADNGFIDIGHRFDPRVGGEELVRFSLRDDGDVVRSEVIQEPSPQVLGTVVRQDRLNRLYFPQPFGPRFLVAYGPGGMRASAVSSRLLVSGYSADGAAWSIAGDAAPGPVLSPEELARAQERIDGYVQRGGGVRSDYPSVPERKTPLSGLMFDREGQLWVAFASAPAVPARANVYNLGELVGERTWPHDVSLAFPAWIGPDHALGIATDTLGVQQVVRIQFESR